MALTDAEKSQTRRYLGFPDVFTQYDLRLESAMESLSMSGEDYVRDLLTELGEIQTALKAARTCLKVAEVVGEVKLRGPEEILTLRHEGNRLAKDLGAALYRPPLRLPFGGGGGTYTAARG